MKINMISFKKNLIDNRSKIKYFADGAVAIAAIVTPIVLVTKHAFFENKTQQISEPKYSERDLSIAHCAYGKAILDAKAGKPIALDEVAKLCIKK